MFPRNSHRGNLNALNIFHKQIVAAVDCLPRGKSISRGEICIEQGVEDKFLVFECLLLSLTATDRSFAT